MEPRRTTIPLTLDEWTERYAKPLKRDLETHVKVWEVDDAETLVRLCLISVRNWAELDLKESYDP